MTDRMMQCPADGCLYVQYGGTLFNHLFTEHDEEDLATVVVHLMTPETDQ